MKRLLIAIAVAAFACAMCPAVVFADERPAAALEAQQASGSNLQAAYWLYADVVVEWNERVSVENDPASNTRDAKYSWKYTDNEWASAGRVPRRSAAAYTLVSLEDTHVPYLVVCDPSDGHRVWGVYGYDERAGEARFATYYDREHVHLCEGGALRLLLDYGNVGTPVSEYAWRQGAGFEYGTEAGGGVGDLAIGVIAGYPYLEESRSASYHGEDSVWYGADGSVVERGAPFREMQARFEARFRIDDSIVWMPVKEGFSAEPFYGQLSSWARQAMTGFSNVAPSDWVYAQGWLDYVVGNGLMAGSGGAFRPTTGVTRGQAVTVLWRLAGEPDLGGAGFADIDASSYACEPARWARAAGLVDGYAGNRFRAGQPVTREQLAKMLCNYAELVAGAGVASDCRALDALSDAASCTWSRPFMGWCVDEGILTGSNGAAKPGATATRAQMAKMLTVLARDALGGVTVDPRQAELRTALASRVGQQPRYFYCTDFDGDGKPEAFAIFGSRGTLGETSYDGGQLWYADASGVRRVTGADGRVGNMTNGVQRSGGRAFLSLEFYAGGSGSTSQVLAVRAGQPVVVPSEGGSFQTVGGGLFKSYVSWFGNGTHEYVTIMWRFDEGVFAFTEVSRGVPIR